MSNLPPGVSDSMIPGNRPEDVLQETVENELALLLQRSFGFDDPWGDDATDNEPFCEAFYAIATDLAELVRRFRPEVE